MRGHLGWPSVCRWRREPGFHSRRGVRPGWLVCLVCLAAIALGAPAAGPRSLDVQAALQHYARGDYAAFADALSLRGAVDKNLYPSFERTTTRWLRTEGQNPVWRRELVAASVALELAHLFKEEPADRAAPYLVWATRLVRERPHPESGEAERLWYLAAMAGMQESDEPWVLTFNDTIGSVVLEPFRWQLGGEGLVDSALKRFPDDSRFLLARVHHQDFRTNDVDWVPALLEFTGAQAKMRVREDPRTPDETLELARRDEAQRALRKYARLPAVIEAYAQLESVDGLRGEVALRLGFLEGARFEWSNALGHLRQVPVLTDDPYLLYLGRYFSGRILETLGERTAAIGAFEEALRILPGTRSASTHLAAELMMSEHLGDRERAYVVLQNAFSKAATDDPWRLYWRGDARLWPVYIRELREALRWH